MNPFVLNPHHDNPKRAFPINGKRQRSSINNTENSFFGFVPVIVNFGDGRPVVMIIVEVVPAHLVHANGKSGFEFRIDAFIYNLS
ncbi:hypothetical protein SDC9_154625 [bioreactor metagenome]|uniref:Uncharacterized protein n=1 Tax=bioreactor metagenome TaxID=1076179 RepID=A0A645F1Q3_9ZZZZ